MTDNLPVSWEDELAKSAKEVAALERPALGQISLRSGVMTYQGQQVPGNKLPAVIIASVFENRYYEGRFDPTKRESPQCFSLSVDGQNMQAHEKSPKPQSTTGCANCPRFQWGSDPNGGKGKACKSVRRLALLPANAVVEGTVASAELALLTIPVTSGKNWANYVTQVAMQNQRPPWAMLTEVSVAPNPKTQFEVKFKPMGQVKEDSLGDMRNRIEGAQQVLMTPYEPAGTIDGTYPGEEPKKDRKF